MFSALTSGPDALPSARMSKRPPTRNRLYRAIAIVTTFAMLFGGLLLMPTQAIAASAVATDYVNLRSEPSLQAGVLTVIPSGATVSVDGDPENGFYPVTWNGTSGYSSVDYISIGGTASPGGGDVTGGAPTGTAWVTTNSLNFRSQPSLSSGVITALAYGTAVTLTGQQSNGFWQAQAAGTTGWLYADYLTTSGAPGGSTTPPPASGSGNVPVGDTATGTATVTTGLNLRGGPGTSYAVVTVMPAGATVELRGDPQNNFYPLSYNGATGWAAADWLSIGGGAPAPTPPPPSGDGSVPVGDAATGSATTTAALNLRSGPGTTYAVRTVMPAGATVELRGDAQNGFLPLNYNGTTGWAAADWLSVGSAPAPTPDPQPAPGNGTVPVGDSATGSATVTTYLNLRTGPGTTYAVVTVMPTGATVELRGDAQNGFLPLSFNGTTGWAAADWLNVGSAPAPTPPPPSGDGSVPVGDSVTGSAVTTASLNLRSGPGTTYAVRTVMPFGAGVELRGEPQNGFYPVNYQGTLGWAAGDWLAIGGSGSNPTTPPGDGSYPQYLYTHQSVNMRSQPTTASGIVWIIPPQTRVTITGPMQDGWYPTAWAHVTGYMHGDFLMPSLEINYPADKQWVVDIIYAAADLYGQPREDMLRVAQCESHLDPLAVNMDYSWDTDRATGLFQFRPSTWATTPYANQDIFDPVANANAAAWMWSVGRRGEWACQ